MKNKVIAAIAVSIFCIAGTAQARCVGPVVNGDCLGTEVGTYNSNSYGSSSNDQNRYRSNSGAEYQYDLNRPGDNIRYQYDYDAQRRDSMSASPRRNLDKRSGQKGGGIYNSW
ncbi:hypothetical protein [Marinobacter sp. S6332]|uniref:hypothetical protein n=1 Tax=Marinobacter sp. S6332 TaxID=2926403 RepID=UPI001FF6A3F8|nr:hypothetical protein [Marinobacter sp. S6332]MCK0163800.1 hypothetical protein [Marinobacter sp. S6332]